MVFIHVMIQSFHMMRRRKADPDGPSRNMQRRARASIMGKRKKESEAQVWIKQSREKQNGKKITEQNSAKQQGICASYWG